MKNYLLLVLLSFIIMTSCNQNETLVPEEELPSPIDNHKTLVVVPDDFTKIQDAINQARTNDTIVVNPGTYSENINFNGKGILLTSMFYLEHDISYISSTIIKGDNGAVVTFMKKESLNAILQGFTITGGTGSIYTRPNGNITLGGGGILGLESSPTIKYNVIENNEAIDVSGANNYAGGGGIRFELGSPNVYGNIIQNNKGNFGGGVFLDATDATFTNNIVQGNASLLAEFGGGGGLYLDFTRPDGSGNKIINNTIIHNLSTGNGGGLVLAGNTVFNKLIFTNNIIYNNQNNEVLTRLGANESDFHPSYSLIEGGYTSGSNIIDANPKLVDNIFTLSEDSPCIDSGDTGIMYKDKNDGEFALPPSKGTFRNDIGSYGGPKAFNLLSNH